MRVGFFSQWYEPEPGPAGINAVTARALAARGHAVHVLTGFPNYPTGTLAEGYRQVPRMREVLGGVHVTRVPLYLSHNVGRSARHQLRVLRRERRVSIIRRWLSHAADR